MDQMTIQEAIDARHSVRAYGNGPIGEDKRQQLDRFAEDCNRESGLHIFLRYDDPEGFDSRLAHYGHFRNVRNYIVLAGKKVRSLISAADTTVKRWSSTRSSLG